VLCTFGENSAGNAPMLGLLLHHAHTARTADPECPKGCSTPDDAMLSDETQGKRGAGERAMDYYFVSKPFAFPSSCYTH